MQSVHTLIRGLSKMLHQGNIGGREASQCRERTASGSAVSTRNAPRLSNTRGARDTYSEAEFQPCEGEDNLVGGRVRVLRGSRTATNLATRNGLRLIQRESVCAHLRRAPGSLAATATGVVGLVHLLG
jgi:hypothetical protein